MNRVCPTFVEELLTVFLVNNTEHDCGDLIENDDVHI